MWEKMAQIDRRWIYGLMIFVIGLALINPIGLAIVPSAQTKAAYDFFDALPNGSYLWLGMEFSAGGIPELMPSILSLLRQGFRKDFKFVCGGMWTMAGDMADQAFATVGPEFPDKTYGVDWVNIGYKPGGDVILQRYLDGFVEGAQGVDFYQNDLSTFPLIKEFPNMKKAAACAVFLTGTPGEKEYIKHVTGPHNIPLIDSCISVSVPEAMPLVQSGQITALIAGMKGAAEYECLVGNPGSATAGMDAQSFSHALIIVFMILGNVGYFMTRNNKKG